MQKGRWKGHRIRKKSWHLASLTCVVLTGTPYWRALASLAEIVPHNSGDFFVRMMMNVSKLLTVVQTTRHFINGLNCWTAAVTKKHRNTYERTYPTVMVLPNGSSINIQYCEPRKIIALPLDITHLSDADRKARLERRKPKTKVTIVHEINVDFDEDKYIKLTQKR